MGGANMWFGETGAGTQVSIIPLWLVGVALVSLDVHRAGVGLLPRQPGVKISALAASSRTEKNKRNPAAGMAAGSFILADLSVLFIGAHS
jgi:hypothetical protein